MKGKVWQSQSCCKIAGLVLDTNTKEVATLTRHSHEAAEMAGLLGVLVRTSIAAMKRHD